MNAKDTAAEWMAEFEPDEEVGELIETQIYSVDDTEIVPGDLIHFRLRREGLEALGFVRAVSGGHELAYQVEVVKHSPPQWTLWVRRCEILMIWVP